MGKLTLTLANRKSAKILGLLQQSQIRKFLRYPSPQIANPQISTSASQLCLKTDVKSSFYLIFYSIQIEVPQI